MLRRGFLKGFLAAVGSLFVKKDVVAQVVSPNKHPLWQPHIDALHDYLRFAQTSYPQRMDLADSFLWQVADNNYENDVDLRSHHSVETEYYVRGRWPEYFNADGSPKPSWVEKFDGDVLPPVSLRIDAIQPPRIGDGSVRAHLEHAFKIEKWKTDPPVSSMG